MRSILANKSNYRNNRNLNYRELSYIVSFRKADNKQ